MLRIFNIENPLLIQEVFVESLLFSYKWQIRQHRSRVPFSALQSTPHCPTSLEKMNPNSSSIQRKRSRIDSCTTILRMRELSNEINLSLAQISHHAFVHHFDFQERELELADGTRGPLVLSDQHMEVAGDLLFLMCERAFAGGFCCVAYAQGGRKRRICIADEGIRGMHYNYHEDSLITVRCERRGSEHRYQNRYRIRRITLGSIRRGRPQEGSAFVFQSDSDDITHAKIDMPNCRALTYDSLQKAFKIYGLSDYELLQAIPYAPFLQEFARGGWTTKFEFQSGARFAALAYGGSLEAIHWIAFEAGSLAKEALLPARHPTEAIEHVIPCGERILLKQAGQGIEIWDVRSAAPRIKTTGIHPRPNVCAPLFLPRTQRFLVLDGSTLRLFNLEGEPVLRFGNHGVDPWLFPNQTHITRDEDLIISSCLPGGPEGPLKIINVSSLCSGRCLTQIASEGASDPALRQYLRRSVITFLKYDEATHEMFTLHFHEDEEQHHGHRLFAWWPQFLRQRLFIK